MKIFSRIFWFSWTDSVVCFCMDSRVIAYTKRTVCLCVSIFMHVLIRDRKNKKYKKKRQETEKLALYRLQSADWIHSAHTHTYKQIGNMHTNIVEYCMKFRITTSRAPNHWFQFWFLSLKYRSYFRKMGRAHKSVL